MAGGAWRAFVSGAPAVRRYYKTKEDKTAGKSAGSFDCRGASFERCADGSFVLTNRERELTLGLNPELLSVVVGDEGERWATALGAAREKADELGLPILGVLRSYKVVGVDPEIMGIGPKEAIPAAVDKAGIKIEDIDLFEINEAFASQAVYCTRELGLDMDKVNVNGGAIALGHPLGCTGAKLTATLLHEMKRRGSRYGVVSMCIGGGMGAAAVFEREA